VAFERLSYEMLMSYGWEKGKTLTIEKLMLRVRIAHFE
jgi:hypothetical protein